MYTYTTGFEPFPDRSNTVTYNDTLAQTRNARAKLDVATYVRRQWRLRVRENELQATQASTYCCALALGPPPERLSRTSYTRRLAGG